MNYKASKNYDEGNEKYHTFYRGLGWRQNSYKSLWTLQINLNSVIYCFCWIWSYFNLLFYFYLFFLSQCFCKLKYFLEKIDSSIDEITSWNTAEVRGPRCPLICIRQGLFEGCPQEIWVLVLPSPDFPFIYLLVLG